MSKITRLENADIEKREDRVIVTTRTAGSPSNPQPQTRSHMPDRKNGQTVEQLYRQLVGEFTNADGE